MPAASVLAYHRGTPASALCHGGFSASRLTLAHLGQVLLRKSKHIWRRLLAELLLASVLDPPRAHGLADRPSNAPPPWPALGMPPGRRVATRGSRHAAILSAMYGGPTTAVGLQARASIATRNPFPPPDQYLAQHSPYMGPALERPLLQHLGPCDVWLPSEPPTQAISSHQEELEVVRRPVRLAAAQAQREDSNVAKQVTALRSAPHAAARRQIGVTKEAIAKLEAAATKHTAVHAELEGNTSPSAPNSKTKPRIISTPTRRPRGPLGRSPSLVPPASNGALRQMHPDQDHHQCECAEQSRIFLGLSDEVATMIEVALLKGATGGAKELPWSIAHQVAPSHARQNGNSASVSPSAWLRPVACPKRRLSCGCISLSRSQSRRCRRTLPMRSSASLCDHGLGPALRLSRCDLTLGLALGSPPQVAVHCTTLDSRTLTSILPANLGTDLRTG